MGQYYTVILKNPQNEFHRYQPSRRDGQKLMEFSWAQSDIAHKTVEQLLTGGHRVYVVGDYAEDSDNKNEGALSYDIRLNALRAYEEEDCKTDFKYTKEYYVENVSKLLYYKIKQQDIFKLFLLCSIGNGKGGGDYSGVAEDEVGTWYGDVIKIVPEEELQKDLYKEYKIEFEEL